MGLGGAALLATGGVGLSLWPSLLREPRKELETLSILEFSVVAAISEAILPAREPFPAPWDIQVPELMDTYLATLHPGDTAEFKQALLLMENGFAGLLLDGRPRPFTTASLEERQATLASWRGSRLPVRRTAFRAIHKLVVSTYYGQPAVYPHMGYAVPVGLARGGR